MKSARFLNIYIFVLVALVVCSSLSVTAQSFSLDEYQAYTSDERSYRVGEPVVVIVMESISAETAAATGVSKSTGISASARDSINPVSVGLGIDADSSGEGKTARKGSVRTRMSTTITEVLPNDMFRIDGLVNITINEELQQVSVSGVIRGADVLRDNTIYSYKIANAKIEIVGEGDVSRTQKQGVIYKVFDWLGLL